MKIYRLVYSDFSSRLINFNYIIRSLWIGFIGLTLVFVIANESHSGFAGEFSIEGIIIYLTVGSFFFLNYLSQSFALAKKLLMFASLTSAIFHGFWGIVSIGNQRFYAVSIGILIIYSLVTASIILFQYNIAVDVASCQAICQSAIAPKNRL